MRPKKAPATADKDVPSESALRCLANDSSAAIKSVQRMSQSGGWQPSIQLGRDGCFTGS